jgi:hypothetical protein
MAQPDPLNAVYALLRADTALTNRVAGRVFNKEMSASENAAMPRACVVISPSGGPGEGGYEQYGRIRIDGWCYGVTLNEAWLVYLDAKAAMKRIDRDVWATVLVHWAKLTAGGTLARDPVNQWPTTLASWSVLVSEIAAA